MLNFKSIVLSEKIQAQRTTHSMILFILHVQKGKSIKTKSRLMVSWDWERKGYN